MLMLAQLPFWRENIASKHEMIDKKKKKKKNKISKKKNRIKGVLVEP